MPNQYSNLPKREVLMVVGPSIAYVTLTGGMYAMIDSEDATLVSQFNWYAKRFRCGWYAARNIGKSTELMHRVVMGNPVLSIDHKLRSTLDNRKSQLRTATASQQCMNRSGWGKSTGVKGVHQRTVDGRFWAYIQVNKKMHHLGVFTDILDAVRARRNAEREFHGEYADAAIV